MDKFLDRIYGYRGAGENPKEVNGQIWAMPKMELPLPWVCKDPSSPGECIQPGEPYFLHYYQSQWDGPTLNECVTTAVLMCKNILTEWIAGRTNKPVESNQRIEEYARELDKLRIRGWLYRFPTKSILPGMMHPRQGVKVLRDLSIELGIRFRNTFSVKLISGHTVEDLAQLLEDGKLLILHGAWHQKFWSKNFHLALMGGMPHTMVLVGYDALTDKWVLLNPAHPMQRDRREPIKPTLYKMTTEKLMEFWGRRFLLYPPRFSITIISIDT
jgi:hypothetical protein